MGTFAWSIFEGRSRGRREGSVRRKIDRFGDEKGSASAHSPGRPSCSSRRRADALGPVSDVFRAAVDPPGDLRLMYFQPDPGRTQHDLRGTQRSGQVATALGVRGTPRPRDNRYAGRISFEDRKRTPSDPLRDRRFARFLAVAVQAFESGPGKNEPGRVSLSGGGTTASTVAGDCSGERHRRRRRGTYSIGFAARRERPHRPERMDVKHGADHPRATSQRPVTQYTSPAHLVQPRFPMVARHPTTSRSENSSAVPALFLREARADRRHDKRLHVPGDLAGDELLFGGNRRRYWGTRSGGSMRSKSAPEFPVRRLRWEPNLRYGAPPLDGA